jgi:hypothetical protein
MDKVDHSDRIKKHIYDVMQKECNKYIYEITDDAKREYLMEKRLKNAKEILDKYYAYYKDCRQYNPNFDQYNPVGCLPTIEECKPWECEYFIPYNENDE